MFIFKEQYIFSVGDNVLIFFLSFDGETTRYLEF